MMNQAAFTILVAVGTALGSTLLAVSAQKRIPDPQRRRMLWIILAAGVAALFAAVFLFL